MKKVNVEELYHLWAQGTDENLVARSSANVKSEGRYLFSYAAVIGARFPNVTYLSSYSYSMTTNKHQSKADRAARGKVVMLDVIFPDSWVARDSQESFEKALAAECRHRGNNILKGLQESLKTAIKINQEINSKLATYEALTDFACTIDKGEAPQRFVTLEDLKAFLIEGKRRDQLSQREFSLQREAGEMQSVREILGTFENTQRTVSGEVGTIRIWLDRHEQENFIEEFRHRVRDIKELGGKVKNHTRYRKLFADGPKIVEAAKKYLEAYEQQQAAKLVVEIQEWRDGGSDYKLPRDLRPLLRLSEDKKKIETSWGASVSVEVAPALWALVCEQRTKQEDLAINMEVGAYTLEWVFASGNIKVGCHITQFSEIQRMALALDYIKVEAQPCKP